MERQPEQPRFSKAIMTIAAAISALALNCSKPDMTRSTTPTAVPHIAEINSDCTKQKEVEYKTDAYFEGPRRMVKTLIDQCIKGTVVRKGRKYVCKVWKTKLKSVKCE
jgi:hypothetical protein